MLQLRRTSLCLLVCLGLVYFADAQVPGLMCPPFTIDVLGSTTEFSDQGLLAASLIPGGETEVRVPVRIMDYRIVCNSTGVLRDTTSFVSVLVVFQCDFDSTQANLQDCDGATVITRQYQYFCSPENSFINNPNGVQTLEPMATLTTATATGCVRCVDGVLSDNINFCEPCPQNCLDTGLGLCYRGELRDPCCSYYNDSRCVEECPSPLEANMSTFDCECVQLSNPNGGSIAYTNGNAIDSVATHTCSTGYRREGVSTRTCTFGGWDGSDVSCVLVECPDLTVANGMVTLDTVSPVLGTRATYSCDDGYGLRGEDSVRTCQLSSTWTGTAPTCEKCTLTELDPNCIGCTFDPNGNEICVCKDGTMVDSEGKCVDEGTTGQSGSSCSPGCIAGIVLAILGAIIMAVVVALVVYAVYSYLSNPATKLAKAGTEGLNGVARDNPLYLPPEDVVEEADKVGDVEAA